MTFNYNDRNFPNLIICGVHKAGTTSIYKYLADHLDVFASLKKELHYFTPLIYGETLKPIEEYMAYFKNAKDYKIRLEASPSYFYGKRKIIENIEKNLGEVKFILVLRDPVERFISFYKQMVKSMQIDKEEHLNIFLNQSIHEYQNCHSATKHPYNRALREGIYVNYIQEWLSLGKERLKIIFFDDIKENPYNLMIDLSNWLGIDSSFYQNYSFSVENKSLQPKNMILHRIAYKFYMEYEVFFRKNRKLKHLLKRCYDMVNNQKFTNESNNDVLEILQRTYSTPNKQLAELLTQYGYHHLPSWLYCYYS